MVRYGLVATVATGSAGMAPAEQTATSVHSSAVLHTVWGIMGYTRWPSDPQTIHLCVAGQSEHGLALLGGTELSGGRKVRGRPIQPQDRQALEGCHVLYAGKIQRGQWAQLMEGWPEGQPLLTISEDAEHCQQGGMFCLNMAASPTVGFELNLDSMARSGVRVNPRVFGLVRRKEVR